MNKTLPDKWVRKAISQAINNIVVDGKIIPCYDTRVTGSKQPKAYVLMTTQTNQVIKPNKCESRWSSSILLDIVTIYDGGGNAGSRLLADDIVDAIRNLTLMIELDPTSGLTVLTQNEDFPNDLSSITATQNVFRKFIRYELIIN
jgi:hypothetical protein